MTKIDNSRKFVNGASLEEAITKVVSLKPTVFDDVVFGTLQESGLLSTIMVKSLLKKLVDSGFTDTEQVIFTSAIIASCINSEEVRSWFSEQNLEFLIDIDNYDFIVTGDKLETDNEDSEEE